MHPFLPAGCCPAAAPALTSIAGNVVGHVSSPADDHVGEFIAEIVGVLSALPSDALPADQRRTIASSQQDGSVIPPQQPRFSPASSPGFVSYPPSLDLQRSGSDDRIGEPGPQEPGPVPPGFSVPPPVQNEPIVNNNIILMSDPSLSWVNTRPYRVCGALGSGAFGTVYKVELLTPLGYTINRDAQGHPRWWNEDTISLRRMEDAELVRTLGHVDRSPDDEAVSMAKHLNPSGFCCALKKITVNSDSAWERCQEEVRLMEKLQDSEEVVRIYDKRLCRENREIIIIMELGEMDFGDYLSSRRGKVSEGSGHGLDLDAAEMFSWWNQMLSAVKVAHDRGIMHCDLKPSNFILVKRRGEEQDRRAEGADAAGPRNYTLKLSDFGLSRQLQDSETHLSEDDSLGTIRYMAPEMVHNSRSDGRLRFGKAADIWSIGIILHQILHAGRGPHAHIERRGNKYRLFLAIADERSARIKTSCPQLLIHPQEQDHDEDHVRLAQARHDVLLGLQWACLQHAADMRATSAQLVSVTEMARQHFFSSSSKIPHGGAVCVDNDLDALMKRAQRANAAADDVDSDHEKFSPQCSNPRSSNGSAKGEQSPTSSKVQKMRPSQGSTVTANAIDPTSGKDIMLSADTLGEETTEMHRNIRRSQGYSFSGRACGGIVMGILAIVVVAGIIGVLVGLAPKAGAGHKDAPTFLPMPSVPSASTSSPPVIMSSSPASSSEDTSPSSSTTASTVPVPSPARPAHDPPSSTTAEPAQTQPSVPSHAPTQAPTAAGAGGPATTQSPPVQTRTEARPATIQSSELPPLSVTSKAPAASPSSPLHRPRPDLPSAIDPLVIGDQALISWLRKVKVHPYSFVSAPKYLQDNRDFVLAAVAAEHQGGRALEFVSAAFQADKEVVLRAVGQDGRALKFAPQLQADREVVLRAVGQDGRALQFASDALKSDIGVFFQAVRQDGRALEFASPALQADKDVVLRAVGQDGYALKFAPALQADREVVLRAVGQYGCALEFASDALQADREVVLAAVRQDGGALYFASPTLRDDIDLRRGFRMWQVDRSGFLRNLKTCDPRSAICDSNSEIGGFTKNP